MRISFKNYFGSWTKIGILVGVLVVALIAFFISREAFITAEVVDFYPTTCLGSWENPERAQGEPETFKFPEKQLDSDNSAFLDKAQGDIYCGQFLAGDYVGEGDIKGVGLTLIWNVVGLPEVVLPEATVPATSTEELTPEDNSSTPKEEVVEENKEESNPPTEEVTPPSSLNRFFVPLVLAQSEEPVVNPPAESSAPVVDSIVEAAPVTETAEEPKPEPVVQSKPAGGDSGNEESKSETTASESEAGVVGATEEVKIGEVLAEPVTEIIYQAPQVVDENFLRVSYSRNGQEWIEIEKISAKNWFHYTVPLPINSWEDLRKVQIKIEGVPSTLGTFPEVYLDGMFVEVQYEKPPIVEIFEPVGVIQEPVREVELPEGAPLIVIPEGEGLTPAPTDEKNFSPNEAPSFEFDLENLPTENTGEAGTSGISPPVGLNHEYGIKNYEGSVKKTGAQRDSAFSFFSPGFSVGRFFLNFPGFDFVRSAKAQSGGGVRVLNEANPVIAQVIDSSGEPVAISPTILTVNNKLRVNVPEPKRSLRPGVYKLKVWVLKEGKVFFSETEFTWGVFAINFDKSIYTLGDTANVGMAVLDEGGRTLCDAQISLRVVTPTGAERNFSTRDGSVIYSDTCGPDNVTSEADYKTDFVVNATGTYKIFATTRTANGLKDFEDQFEVQENPLFDVARSGPTRIYPPAEYRVGIKITPREDFDGIVKEVVPAEFHVIANVPVEERVVGEEKILIWDLDLKAGESQEISYIFKAPDISPEFYKLGPLSFYEDNDYVRPVFSEVRSWQIAADAVVNSGSVMAYGDTNDDDNLNRRILNTTSTWSAEGTTVDTGTGGDIKHVVIKAAPTRNEFVAGHLDINGRLSFVVASNTTWSNLFQASSSAAQTCDGTLGACNQTFDLAYEQLSGEALMVYGSSSNDGIIYYRTWNGSATSSESSFTFRSGSSVDTNWVRLVPKGAKLTDNRSDEMMLLVGDNGGVLSAVYWNGTQFLSSTTLHTMPTAAGRTFDGAWETNNGNFVAVYASSSLYATNGPNTFAYKKFSGGSWGAPASVGNFPGGVDGEPNGDYWVAMDADPLSNRIAAGFVYVPGGAVSVLDAEGIWKSDGATEGWTVTSTASALEAVSAFGQVQAAFERFGSGNSTSSALFTRNNAAGADTPSYRTWISGTGFSAAANIPFIGATSNSNWEDDGNHRKLVPSPNDDEMMWLGVDSDNDLGSRLWTGSAWDTNALNRNLSTVVGKATDDNATPNENNAFDFAYKPYSPWSLNWRWYNGTSTANAPTDALAAENTSSSIASSSMKLRLRFNVAERGGNSQTDARKKLQFTTSTNPNASSSSWTDVGNVESSTLWRYFDIVSASSTGDDGTIINSTVLSSSTTAGWWNISKDATASSSMDQASTTITELEFPIEGNSATFGFTYYFRMYDVSQGSPVYRQQASWPATPCNSGVACTYPSIVLSDPAPSVPSVTLNGGSAITLLPNTTTTVYVNFTVTDADGCADVFTNGNVTTTMYRSGVFGTCSTDNQNCYRVSTTTHNCVSGNTANGTSTFDVYYFSQATDGTSAFPSQYWEALVEARDGSSNSNTATSTGVELNGLLAIELVTSTINYGSLNPTSTMGAVNRIIPIKNVGNSSNTIQVYGSALKKGIYSIATSSQHYASSSFVFGGNEGVLSNTATTISGITLLPAVSVLKTIGAWTDTTALSRGLLYHTVAKYGNYVYVIGGAPGAAGTTTTVKYAQVSADGTLGSWTDTTALPTGLAGSDVAAWAGYMYVVGGGTSYGNSAANTTTVMYATINSNGTLGSWTNTTALPSALQSHRLVVSGGKLYVLGGLVASNTGTSTVKYASINTDGTIGNWSNTTAMSAALYEFSVGFYNRTIYTVGGEAAGSPISNVYYGQIGSDGTIGGWSAGTNLPNNLNDNCSFAGNGYLYSLPGNTGADSSPTATIRYSIISSDGSNGSWTNTTAYPVTAAWYDCTLTKGFSYVMSGSVAGSATGTTTVKYASVSSSLTEVDTFWGLGLLDYVPTGTYMGSTTFIGVFAP